MSIYSLLAMAAALGVLVVFWFRRAPMVQGLALANFVVFLVTIATGSHYTSIEGSPLLDDLAFRPAYVVHGDWAHVYTVVTAAFLHADFAHIIGNMLILLMAGLPFEERLGRGRFLIVYFFSAISAVLLHVLWNRYALGVDALQTPVVGASGAVFGILGGFAATYPRDQIPMILLVVMLPRVPVIIAAMVFSLVEIVSLFAGAPSGVAHAAHIGGAVGGAIAAPLVKPRDRRLPSTVGGRKIDYDRLRALAADDKSRAMVERVKENGDTPELQRAWLDRLFVALRCPQCGAGFAESGPGTLECEHGHRERYVTD